LKHYRAALKDTDRREALDELIRACDWEMAAVLYCDPFHLFDMLVLTGPWITGGRSRSYFETLRR